MGAKGLPDNANHGGDPRLVARLSRKDRLVRRATWFRDTYSWADQVATQRGVTC